MKQVEARHLEKWMIVSNGISYGYINGIRPNDEYFNHHDVFVQPLNCYGGDWSMVASNRKYSVYGWLIPENQLTAEMQDELKKLK